LARDQAAHLQAVARDQAEYVRAVARDLQAVAGDLRQVRDLLNALVRRVDALDAGLYAVPYAADVAEDVAGGSAYSSFEAVFRGSEDRVRDLLRPYVRLLRDHEPVLDVGCGRGELLDLLREADVAALGVDVDRGMAERARAKGHEVEVGDAVEYLARQPAGRFGAITAIHVIEHLPYEQLLRFFELAHEKLRPGGLLAAETVNPHSLQAFKTFWTDLTHQAPIFPEVAATLARAHGFSRVEILYPRGSGDGEMDRREQTEYALVATR
jgi:O-antigen chain-terminating methyltransferase